MIRMIRVTRRAGVAFNAGQVARQGGFYARQVARQGGGFIVESILNQF